MSTSVDLKAFGQVAGEASKMAWVYPLIITILLGIIALVANIIIVSIRKKASVWDLLLWILPVFFLIITIIVAIVGSRNHESVQNIVANLQTKGTLPDIEMIGKTTEI